MAFFSESGGWYLNAFFLMASRGQKGVNYKNKHYAQKNLSQSVYTLSNAFI